MEIILKQAYRYIGTAELPKKEANVEKVQE